MNVKELIEQLAKLPPEAEVLVSEKGDPSVGIYDACYSVKSVWHDGHRFIDAYSDPHDTDCCDYCGVLRVYHTDAPTIIYMEVEA